MSQTKFRFSIDRGGTFTDVYAELPRDPAKPDAPTFRLLKLLSEDPSYPDAPREAIRRILEEHTGIPHPPSSPVDSSRIESIRMGTTVATNALLERKGERTAFVVTKGFRDLLWIGNQSRPRIFDLVIERPERLYREVVEVDERVRILPAAAPAKAGEERKDDEKSGPAQEGGEFELDEGDEVVIGRTMERVVILRRPDLERVRRDLSAVYARGIRSLAVCLAHSYTFPDHEAAVGAVAASIGFTHITLSHEIMAMVKLVPRSFTACADAYLTPCIQAYLDQFLAGFDDQVEQRVQVLFMQSDGGLTERKNFHGFRAVLSGPAGGVVGYSQTTPMKRKTAGHVGKAGGREAEEEQKMAAEFDRWTQTAVIGFDMGGTSTDVSRHDGRYEHVTENTTAGVTIQAPQLDINTVAAGGGSKLFFRSGLFVVGPESAGANPGPACYRRGGPLTITDANLVLNRLVPSRFPAIFGEKRNEGLDVDASRRLFAELTATINDYWARQETPKTMTTEDVALGFIAVANEAMCRPIRALTQAKGYDIQHHTLACFGGAGGQHASAIARNLGIHSIFIHRFSGILSAYGMGLADIVHEKQEPCALTYEPANHAAVHERMRSLEADAKAVLVAQGFTSDDVEAIHYLNLRYLGTDTAVMTRSDSGTDYEKIFAKRYMREYGFVLNRPILVDDIRVRVIGKSRTPRLPTLRRRAAGEDMQFDEVQTFYQQGWLATRVYQLSALYAGDAVEGPAMLIDNTSTLLVEPGCTASITSHGDVLIIVGTLDIPPVSTALDSIQLSIFSHRFMSIAEQMGRTLQRTSVSTNIKERLDYSCALFGPDGGLVANAPHLPVHLGAMQEAVRFQVKRLGDDWKDGDVVLSNHPQAGGSHLPDITVITPVFSKGQKVFFVASRGHHADIGGISAGSMPPFSKHLYEEGAAVVSFKLVKTGVFDEAGITAILQAPGELPQCSGTRNLSDNLSDLRAQVAANQRGIRLMGELIEQYGLDVVQAYMKHIQDNAEVAVREMLSDLSRELGLAEVDTLRARDFMDDGSEIRLALTIDRRDGSAIFDFAGTTAEVYGNINSPPAVTYSAIIYCLRCLVKRDIPLNQGCLNSISVRIPPSSFLNPSASAAVVGGNVLTSQRVTDVVLRAFHACAASQGCMNNFTMGDRTFGYYETIAGGAGAGKGWHGQSGTHTHMTNCFPAEDHQVFTRHGFMYLHEVQAHLAKYGALDIGCYVNGVLEYHAIGPDAVVVDEGTHDHVEMMEEPTQDAKGRSKATSGISLLPTVNHRMYLRMGRTIGAARHWPQVCVGRTSTRPPPPFAVHTAQQVVAAGRADDSTVIQFDTHFEHGRHARDSVSSDELPFVAPLRLSSEDEIDAVIELLGYFLGDGWLDARRQGVCFGPSKVVEWDYLDALFARLHRVLPLLTRKKPQGGYRTVLHGVYVAPRPAVPAGKVAGPQRDYCIYSHNWFDLCAAEFAHKYKGDAFRRIAQVAAEQRGGAVPRGRCDDEVDGEAGQQRERAGRGVLQGQSGDDEKSAARVPLQAITVPTVNVVSRPTLMDYSDSDKHGQSGKQTASSWPSSPSRTVASSSSSSSSYAPSTPSSGQSSLGWSPVSSTAQRGHQSPHSTRETPAKKPRQTHQQTSPRVDVAPPDAEKFKSAKWMPYWVWLLGKLRARLLLSGLRFADGDESIGSVEGGQIGTSSARFRDEIARLAIHAGYSVVFVAQHHHYKVSYSENQRRIHPKLHVPTQCKVVQRTGTVWCVQVPTAQQLIMFRRVLKTNADGTISAVSRGVIVGNTRITDPEVMERRYPVLVEEFGIRHGSGGAGLWSGGDGVVRRIRFLRPLSIGILSERRAFAPWGLDGGEDAQRGVNLLVRRDGSVLNLGGKNTYSAQRGDAIVILSPGGGGYGRRDSNEDEQKEKAGADTGFATVRVVEVVKETVTTTTTVMTKGGSLSEYQALQEQA